MSILETELKSEVIENLEIDSSAAADLARFKVYENLNAAELDIINSVDTRFLRAITKNYIENLVISQSDYPVQTDFIRLVEVWVDFDSAITDANPGTRAYPFDQAMHSLPMNSVATQNFPMYDLDAEDLLILAPIPSANQTSGLKWRYVRTTATIASGTNSDLSPAFKNLLIYRATELSALVDNYRPELSDKFAAKYETELQKFLPKEE